ncbi:MAG: isopentenyl phosphate kinase family protein [Anaerolineae bacterium]|nr:isopentenyl phosphate kinase family protein [Anaerolineae bacterium]
MTELVFVKLGGSVITDKRQPSTPCPAVIRRLAQEIKAARQARPNLQILLGHGSGSFGHMVGAQYRLRQGLADDGDWWGYAATGVAAAQLNRIVADAFIEAGMPVVAIQPSASARCRDGELVSMATWPVAEALRRGLVPLIYGDVAFDEVQGCTIISTEAEFTWLARQLRPQRMVMVGQVDGVFDRDPLQHPDTQHIDAKRIDKISPATFDQIAGQLGGSHGIDVTGGMLSKVRQMIDLVRQGLTGRVHLISGLNDGALERVLLDPDAVEGTVIEAN